MANANNDAKHLPVFKLDGRKNKMEFIRGFPGIADHFGVRRIIYEDLARPVGGDNLAERQAAWDELLKQSGIGEVAVLRDGKGRRYGNSG